MPDQIDAEKIDLRAAFEFEKANPGKYWHNLKSGERAVWWVKAMDIYKTSAVATHD